MPKAPPVLIPPGDPEGLRRQTVTQINRINQQIAKSSQRAETMDLGHNRITSVADPGAPTDAVNLRTLKKHLDDITLQHVQRQNQNTSLYSAVFSSIGTLVSGQASAPYIIMPKRAGTPVVVKVACATSGTGTATATFNVARNGTNIMATPILFPPNSTAVVTATNFNSSAKFDVNDLITPVVSVAGGMSFVTIEVEVQP